MRLAVTRQSLIIACVAGWPAAGFVCVPGAALGAFLAEWTRIEASALESPGLDPVQLTGSSLRARLWSSSKKHTAESGGRTLRLGVRLQWTG
ncbi:MAG: hypothetical protein OXH68_09215 [Gammaproteobacteria bacterium]|nr:hypothetical protein [Gammaproteobacteria bacterium]